MRIILLLLMMFLCSCSPRMADTHVARYQYLKEVRTSAREYPQFTQKDEYFLVVLVEAMHLDYSSPESYLGTMTHGLFFSKEPDTGHAWIILGGKKNGKPWIFEGGHSVDDSLDISTCFNEIKSISSENKMSNPARLLSYSFPEGVFEYGPGGYTPSMSAAFPITEDQFKKLAEFIDKGGYDYSRWGIHENNCVHFSVQCLEKIGISIDCAEKLVIPECIYVHGEKITLWDDPAYSIISAYTPDLLEKRLWQLVKKGKAFIATKWYSNFKKSVASGKLTTDEVPGYPKVPTTRNRSKLAWLRKQSPVRLS